MIYSNHGKVDYMGTKADIVTDIIMLLRNLKEEDIIDSEDIQDLVGKCLLSKEEIAKEVNEFLKDMLKKFNEEGLDEDSDETFRDIFGDIL